MPETDRILDISEAGGYLSVRYDQVRLERENELLASIPASEIAVLVLAHPRIVATHAVFERIMNAGGAVLICDDRSLPTGLMLPLVANSMQTARMIAQVQQPRPTGKRLWQQIVREKVLSQAAALQSTETDDGTAALLRNLAGEVRSGDPANIEAQAAARYWPVLFGPEFRRRRDADDHNRLLNYGYAILRAAMARAICASGLHPSIGVFHRSRSNPWCLADDLMEPYRPLVDEEVHQLVGLYGPDAPLDREAKSRLAGLLKSKLTDDREQWSIIDHLARTASSLARVFEGETRKIHYPSGLRDGAGQS